MKKILLLIMMSLPLAMMAQAPADGDYRSVATGNWSDVNTWQVRSGGAWSTPAQAPTAVNNVYMQTGFYVTVDVAAASVKDLQSNPTGQVAIGTNILNVHGKMRGYTGNAVVSAADDDFYSSQLSTTTLSSTMITTSGAGLLKIVGDSRVFMTTGEWAGSGMQNCNAEFALNANQIITVLVTFKFRNITFSSGKVDCGSSARVGADDNSSTGTITIKNGATVVSARSGAASQVFSATAATRCGSVTIEPGGVLELTGSSPAIDATTIVNNGTVMFTRAGAQTLLQKGADPASAPIPTYSTLILGGSNGKTPFNAFSVSTMLQFTGTATLAATALLPITMLNNSTVDRSVTSGTSLPSTAGAVFYGTAPTDLVHVTIGATIANSNEIPSAPTPGKVGTLTIRAGVTYTFGGSRAFTDLVNNGIVQLTPSTTFTITINGNISGPGTITGHPNASLTFAGANNGNAGTLNLTAGSQNLNVLTINRTGTSASVTLGTPVTLNALSGSGNLSLTAGTLIGGTNLITVNGSINGSGTVTSSGAGKVLMTGNTGVASIASVTMDNLELNNANGFSLSGSPVIAGTLTMTNGNITIPATRTMRISSGNAIAGAPFSSSKYVRCEIISPNVGSLRMDNLASTTLFPVGSLTNYLPVNLSPGSAMDFLVNVFEGATQNGAPDGIPATATQKESLVDAIWTINRLNGAGSCDVELNWVTPLEGSVFTTLADNLIGVGRYNGVDFGIVSGSGNNTANYAAETFTNFSPFIVARKGALVLPVNLKSFSATLKPAGVELNWKVENEVSIKNYIIERSMNGRDFTSAGAINATNRTNYSFTDPSILTGILYYRLKIIGLTGDLKYSDILLVKQNNTNEITLYPNPVVDKVTVSGAANGSTYRIVNANGQVILEQKATASTFNMDVSGLQSGVYFVEIVSTGNGSVKRSFIKQ